MSDLPSFPGYTFLAEETFAVGPSVELVPIYRSEAFAAALGLPADRRDARAEFALVPGGSFRMGLDAASLPGFAALNEECGGGLDASSPAHEVQVDSFLIARTPLTQEVWDGLAASLDLELWDQRYTESPYLPVHGLSWSYFTGIAPDLGLRLPTEAEWEYAATAGAGRPFVWGDAASAGFEYGWYGHPHEGGPMGVAQKRPNGFGLYDVIGNVWEMCADFWHDDYRGAPADGSAWLGDDDPLQRVIRGASYRSEIAAHVLATFRSSAGIYFTGDDVGVRPVAAVSAVE